MRVSDFRRAPAAAWQMLVLLLAVAASPAAAAPDAVEAKPKPVVVIGDSLAEGLHSGLYTLLKQDGLAVEKKTQISTGLVRKDKRDWTAVADGVALAHAYSAAIVTFGANDLVSFRTPAGPVHYGDVRWRSLYADRVAEIIRHLQAGGLKVFWVSLPVTRADRFQKDYAFLNDIFRETAAREGAVYVDTWTPLSDNGQYTNYGADIAGKSVVLRHTDGVHFTPDGYLRYARIVLDAVQASGYAKAAEIGQ